MRVGGLGVVDPGDAVDLGDGRDPVPVGPEGAQPVADRGRGDAVRAGQRGGGERVGDEVRAPGEARSAIVQSSAALAAALLDEGPVGEDVVDHADHPDAGHAEGEADRPGALDDVGLADQLLGLRVGDVVDARALRRARRSGPCRRRSRHADRAEYQSRWSSATLSTAADSALIESV